MNNYIIGIAGHKNAGKDTIANMINYIFKRGITKATYADWAIQQVKLYNIQDRIIHFADNVKDVLSILFSINRIYFDNRRYKDVVYFNLTTGNFIDPIIAEHDRRYHIITNEELKNNTLKNILDDMNGIFKVIKLRTLLQYFGTDICRNQLKDSIWIDSTMSKAIDIAQSRRVCIIADVRFENEAERIMQIQDKSLYGGVIKIIRNTGNNDNHVSEQDIKNYNYLIENNGSLMQLFYKVLEVIENII